MDDSDEQTGARLFTLEEANALIPWLQETMNRVQQRHGEVQDRLAEWMYEQGLPPESRTPDLLRKAMMADPLIEGMVLEIEAGVKAIQSEGCVFQGIELGLVDFPHDMEGEVVFLCWQAGESEIGFWHSLDTGFRGRQPLYQGDPTKVIN